MAFKKKFVLKMRFPLARTARKLDEGKRPVNRKTLKVFLALFLFISACVLGSILGAYVAIKQNLPSMALLEEFEPKIITNIYADEGEVIGEYAEEKRIEVSYEEIPDVLKNAIIATEDPRFYRHHGIDFLGILRAVKQDIKIRKRIGRLHGGSTISQQLTRALFLHRRQTIRRKIKEALLALQIEKKYSKQQILTMYCNQFWLGSAAWGVESASRLYFGKKVSELSLEEAALIAGIFRGPARYDPYKNRDDTFGRRNHVLKRMLEEAYINREEYERARTRPLNVLPLRRRDTGFAAYFNEEVRRYVADNYGTNALYRRGLRVYTTLNPTLQKYAEQALSNGLRRLDKRQGWRKDKRNLLNDGIEDLENLAIHFLDSWLKPTFNEGEVVDAVVLTVRPQEAYVKLKDYMGVLSNEDIDWTKTKNLRSLIKRGDVIQVKLNKIDEENKQLLVSLDQEPLLEGAFLAIEPQSGQVKAMVGGYDFKRSEWNNATQALRQAGSAIKPILYTAALESGFSPSHIIIDEPTDFIDKWTNEPWTPPNYDGKYKGAVTLRKGLEESRNIVTAKILEFISPQKGVNYCRKFGITSPVYPYLSLSLGSFEVRMIELVSAFSAFPNKGVRIKPYFINRIEDKEGNVLEENKSEAEEVISPQVAYMMTSLLQGVIKRGTGIAASLLDWPLGGKTGTTNDFTDAWFIGFSPSLCAGVWVGHHTQVTIGERVSGAVAALPVWIEFFQKVIGDKKKRLKEGDEFVIEEFEIPPNLSFVEVDSKTGLLAGPFCVFVMTEVFLPGTEPTRFCTPEDHLRILDYYGFKKKEERDDH